MATRSSILWKIPGTEESGRATIHGVANELDQTGHSTGAMNGCCWVRRSVSYKVHAVDESRRNSVKNW